MYACGVHACIQLGLHAFMISRQEKKAYKNKRKDKTNNKITKQQNNNRTTKQLRLLIRGKTKEKRKSSLYDVEMNTNNIYIIYKDIYNNNSNNNNNNNKQ